MSGKRPPRKDLAATVGFVELASENPDRTRRFLEDAFDWRFAERETPGGPYLSFSAAHGGSGGVRPTRPSESPATLTYVRVADLEEALARVKDAGGTVVLPRVDVPQMGSFFWFKVPGGPILACWQDAPAGTQKEK